MNGKIYTIEKSQSEYSNDVEYIFSVWDKEDGYNNNDGFKRPLSYSWIHPSNIELKDGNLWISESWCNSCGVLRYYIGDVKLHNQMNVYFMISSERDIVGTTNDNESKYFKKSCVIVDGDCVISDNYYELPFDEQLSFCKSLESKGEYIYYDVTQIIETEKFFG